MVSCGGCGRDCRLETVSEVFQIEGRRVLVENIPVQVCLQCGEMTFSRATTARVRRMLHGDARPVGVVELDLFAY